METRQNATVSEPATESASSKVAPPYRLTPVQDAYITYVAANGFIVNEDGLEPKKMKAVDFAEKVGVHRSTLYRWQDEIPAFWDLVDKRSREIFNKNRKYVILNGLFLRAAKGDSKQAEMLLSHFGDYVPPTQKHEVRVGGLADLAKLARSKENTHDPNNT